MKIEIFALCDAATVEGGKLNILGAFDSITANAPPVVHPHCAVAIRLRFQKIEEGNHDIKVNLIDEDGTLVVPSIEGSIEVQFGSDAEARSSSANTILNFQGLKFEEFGRYQLDLALDGKYEASIPLTVKRAD